MSTTIVTISEVLSNLLERSQITEAALARALNIPRATINKIHAGKILDPRSSTLNMIASYFGITLDQLIGKAPLFNEVLVKFVQVPMISIDAIKSSNQILQNINFINHNSWVLIEYDNKLENERLNLFAIKTESDAMLPYFDEKTTIIIDVLAKIENRKYVLAYIKSIDDVILRQIFIDGTTKILKPINSIFEQTKLTPHDRIIGVVVQTKRDF